MLGDRTNLATAQATGSARTAAAALRFAENTAPVIFRISASGITSLKGIAARAAPQHGDVTVPGRRGQGGDRVLARAREPKKTTYVHVEADLATKKRALDTPAPMPPGTPVRYRPHDKLMAFLAAL